MVVFLAFIIALAGFSGFSLTAPVAYPFDTVWDQGLIRDIIFNRTSLRTLDFTHVSLGYRNPTDHAVSLNLTYPSNYTVYINGHIVGGDEGHEERKFVMVPAGDFYNVRRWLFITSEESGWYEVEWGGVRKGIAVYRNEAVPRIVTNKETYTAGDIGTAVFEYYNPTSYNITLVHPERITYSAIDEDRYVGNRGSISADWGWPYGSLAPGESVQFYRFEFATYNAVGKMTITVNDVEKIVEVLPR
jgi:hypothetical protein